MPQIDFKKPQYFDNFLPKEEFEFLQDAILNETNQQFPFYIQKDVAKEDDGVDRAWSFMGIHRIYFDNQPASFLYEPIKEIFLPKFRSYGFGNALIRIKANFYPNTSEVKEHPMHTDYAFKHHGALFSINTCNGYTKFKNGWKVESVANRMLFFDPTEEHCSSTTSDTYGRFNINFNFI